MNKGSPRYKVIAKGMTDSGRLGEIAYVKSKRFAKLVAGMSMLLMNHTCVELEAVFPWDEDWNKPLGLRLLR
jgi:hypothetical protein